MPEHGRAAVAMQVVVDAIDPSVIVSPCASKTFDFGSVSEPELTNFSIPLKLQIGQLSPPVSPHPLSLLTPCQPPMHAIKASKVGKLCVPSCITSCYPILTKLLHSLNHC